MPSLPNRFGWLRCLAMTLPFVACVGSVQGPGASAGGGGAVHGGTGAAAATGGRGGHGGAIPDPPPGACAAAQPWRSTPLTRAQYVNAASDLLGFDVAPLVTFADAGGRKFTPGVALTAMQVDARRGAARAIASAATEHLARLLPCAPAALDAACADRFVAQLGLRAFRRPLDAAATKSLRDLFEAGRKEGGAAAAVEWTIDGLLQAPDFLYHVAPAAQGRAGAAVTLDAHALASRVAFFLWNSPPDAALLERARTGALASSAGITAEVERMLREPRAARLREDFYHHWLKLDELAQTTRETPGFDATLTKALARSVLHGIDELFAAGGDHRELLSSATLHVDAQLAGLYGGSAPGTTLTAVARPGERHGILTHPALLTLLANPDSSDPIRRGVFVSEEVFCQVVPDPIPDLPDLPPLREGLSTRARLEQHRAAPACAGCHQFFDPLGMAFEHYDEIGRHRAQDRGVAVDSSGEVMHALDIAGKFASGRELLGKIAASADAADCTTRRWFEYAVSRDVGPGEACALDALEARFRSSRNLVDLIAAIATSDTFRHVQVLEE